MILLVVAGVLTVYLVMLLCKHWSETSYRRGSSARFADSLVERLENLGNSPQLDSLMGEYRDIYLRKEWNRLGELEDRTRAEKAKRNYD